MNCKRCGAKIEKGCFFCDRCGQSVGTVAELEELSRRESIYKKKKVLIAIVILVVILTAAYSVAKLMYDKKKPDPQPVNTDTVLTDKKESPAPEKEDNAVQEPVATSEPVAESVATAVPTASPTVKPTATPVAKATPAPAATPMAEVTTAPAASIEPVADDAVKPDDQTVQTTSAPSDGSYLYPSDTTLFTSEYLASLNRQTARLVRNELYARHGLVFKTADLKNYFSAKSWYKPVAGLTTTQILYKFNATERSNHSKLVSYEKSKGWIR